MVSNVQSYELVSRIPKEIAFIFVFSSESNFSQGEKLHFIFKTTKKKARKKILAT